MSQPLIDRNYSIAINNFKKDSTLVQDLETLISTASTPINFILENISSALDLLIKITPEEEKEDPDKVTDLIDTIAQNIFLAREFLKNPIITAEENPPISEFLDRTENLLTKELSFNLDNSAQAELQKLLTTSYPKFDKAVTNNKEREILKQHFSSEKLDSYSQIPNSKPWLGNNLITNILKAIFNTLYESKTTSSDASIEDITASFVAQIEGLISTSPSAKAVELINNAVDKFGIFAFVPVTNYIAKVMSMIDTEQNQTSYLKIAENFLARMDPSKITFEAVDEEIDTLNLLEKIFYCLDQDLMLPDKGLLPNTPPILPVLHTSPYIDELIEEILKCPEEALESLCEAMINLNRQMIAELN